jgi:hypothetical protein
MNRGLHILPVSSATVMRLGNIRAGHHLKFRLRECLPGGELGKQLRIILPGIFLGENFSNRNAQTAGGTVLKNAKIVQRDDSKKTMTKIGRLIRSVLIQRCFPEIETVAKKELTSLMQQAFFPQLGDWLFSFYRPSIFSLRP